MPETFGTDMADSFSLYDEQNWVYSAGGDDTVAVQGADDLVQAGEGNDRIWLRSYGDGRAEGEDGDDVLFAQAQGEVTMLGGKGDDMLAVLSSSGAVLRGGGGNDQLIVQGGDAIVYGGRGEDTFQIAVTGHQGRVVVRDFDADKDAFRFDFGDRDWGPLEDLATEKANGNLVLTFEDQTVVLKDTDLDTFMSVIETVDPDIA